MTDLTISDIAFSAAGDCSCNPRSYESCCIRAAAVAALRGAADVIEKNYPPDVFLPDGTSPDACAAKGVRVACNQMRRIADGLSAEADA